MCVQNGLPANIQHTFLRLMPFGSNAPDEYRQLELLVYESLSKDRSASDRVQSLHALSVFFRNNNINIPDSSKLTEEIAEIVWTESSSFEAAEILLKAQLDTADLYIHEVKLQGEIAGVPTIIGKSRGRMERPPALVIAIEYLAQAVAKLSEQSSEDLSGLPEAERCAAIRLLRIYATHAFPKSSADVIQPLRRNYLQNTILPVWNALRSSGFLKDVNPGIYSDPAINRIVHALSDQSNSKSYAGLQSPASDAKKELNSSSIPAKGPSEPWHQVIKDSFPLARDDTDRDLLKRYEILRGPMLLALLPNPIELETCERGLLHEFPWATDATGAVFEDLRIRQKFGSQILKFSPLLLVGPPGAGKTRLARRIGEVLGLNTMILKLGGSTDSMALTGTSRGWSTGQPSSLLLPLLKGTASALVILDEVDKAGDLTRNSPPVQNVLLGLLELEDARRWRDGFLQVECDLSSLLFILTANDTTWLSNSLKSRIRIIEVGQPAEKQMLGIVPYILRDLESEWGIPEESLLGADIDSLLPKRIHSIRELRRFVKVAISQWMDLSVQSLKH